MIYLIEVFVDSLNSSTFFLKQRRLAQLAAHLVVALIALVVVGGATRVMEAGLACPDWPLCFGSFLPGHQMNLKVFLEWFHRLDAFLIGIFLTVQFGATFLWRHEFPSWVPKLSFLFVLLVAFQGLLGALTVWDLLPSSVVVSHLALGLTLVALMSGFTQRLLSPYGFVAPLWWRIFGSGALLAVFGQCLLGGRMATTWAAKRCLAQGQACQWLSLHHGTAIFVTGFVLLFVFISLYVGGWPRSQWPFLVSISGILIIQIFLGLLTVRVGLDQPLITVLHQLAAALLIAFLSALISRRPQYKERTSSLLVTQPHLEPCHG